MYHPMVKDRRKRGRVEREKERVKFIFRNPTSAILTTLVLVNPPWCGKRANVCKAMGRPLTVQEV